MEVVLNDYGLNKKSEMEQTDLENIKTGFKREDLDIQKKIQLWKDPNMLKKIRSLIFCDPENGWNDIITGNILKRTSKIARF